MWAGCILIVCLFFYFNCRRTIIIRIRKGKSKKKATAQKERINRQITATTVRLVGADGSQMGIISLSDALDNSRRAKMDLVEVSPKANPPVCKILDFGKYHYQKERSLRESKKKQHKILVKEIKFGPLTEQHDYEFKLKNAIKFLQAKDKVRFTIRFKGRQLANKQLGYQLLEKIKIDMQEYANLDIEPISEGRVIFMIMSPKKEKTNKGKESKNAKNEN